MENRLTNACKGLTSSQGGLNADEIRQVLGVSGQSRQQLETLLAERCMQTGKISSLDLPMLEKIASSLPMDSLLAFRATNKSHKDAADNVLVLRYRKTFGRNPETIKQAIHELKISCTVDLDKIKGDFGRFPRGIYYNPYGIFRKGNHIVKVGLVTNAGMYYTTECNTEGCPGRGYNSGQCPHLRNVRLTSSNNLTLINELLAHGFCYQMITNEYGINTYFDISKKDITKQRKPLLTQYGL
jgi:hypothetical protein